MKQRLNLDNLLKKYEQSYGLDFTPTDPVPTLNRKVQKVKTEGNEDRGQYNFVSKYAVQQVDPPEEYYSTGNFQMSRSEC